MTSQQQIPVILCFSDFVSIAIHNFLLFWTGKCNLLFMVYVEKIKQVCAAFVLSMVFQPVKYYKLVKYIHVFKCQPYVNVMLFIYI